MNRPMYYKNAETGVQTMDKRDVKRWNESGVDVEIWYYSETLEEWICGMVMEGRTNA